MTKSSLQGETQTEAPVSTISGKIESAPLKHLGDDTACINVLHLPCDFFPELDNTVVLRGVPNKAFTCY